MNHILAAYTCHRVHFEFSRYYGEMAVAMVVDSDKQPPPIWERDAPLAGLGNVERAARQLERECSVVASGLLSRRLSEFDPSIADWLVTRLDLFSLPEGEPRQTLRLATDPYRKQRP